MLADVKHDRDKQIQIELGRMYIKQAVIASACLTVIFIAVVWATLTKIL